MSAAASQIEAEIQALGRKLRDLEAQALKRLAPVERKAMASIHKMVERLSYLLKS